MCIFYKKTKEQYLYFAEAVTETYKTGYQKSKNRGQVKIIKSLVNEFPGADTLNVKFCGGVFSGSLDDIETNNSNLKIGNFFFCAGISLRL